MVQQQQKRVGVKLRDRYYLCTVTGTEGARQKDVTAVCVKNADKISYKIHSEDPNPPNLVELLTEGLDRKIHLDRFKRTLARIPVICRSMRPQSAPTAGRHHRHPGRGGPSLDSSDSDGDLAYLALTAMGCGPMTTPRTVRMLKGERHMAAKGEDDVIVLHDENSVKDHGSHGVNVNLMSSASEAKGVLAESKEAHASSGRKREEAKVPSLKRLHSLPAVLDAIKLSTPAFSPRDQRVDEGLLKAHVASSSRPLRDPVALQRQKAKARTKPSTPGNKRRQQAAGATNMATTVKHTQEKNLKCGDEDHATTAPSKNASGRLR